MREFFDPRQNKAEYGTGKMRISALFATLLILSCLTRDSSAEDPPQYLLKWGSPGSGPGQFRNAADITSDGAGNIYVADVGNRRIQKFSNTGAYLGELDAAESGPAAFTDPSSSVVDGAGNLYITDSRGFIDVFDAAQTFVRSWPVNFVDFLALDPTGQFIYATVYDSIITYDTTTGARIRGWTYTGAFPSLGHYSFDAGPSGAIYIGGVDGGAFVAKYSPTGVRLRTWGGTGTGDGQFDGSRGVAVDAMENVYVGDGNGRVQKFTADGVFVSAWGSLGTGNGQFTSGITNLTTDPAGNIFVFDSFLQRIQKFGYPATPVHRTTWGGLKGRYR